MSDTENQEMDYTKERTEIKAMFDEVKNTLKEIQHLLGETRHEKKEDTATGDTGDKKSESVTGDVTTNVIDAVKREDRKRYKPKWYRKS